MNKTSADVMNILLRNISNSSLFTDPNRPTGELYKWKRPSDSVLEDVVINTLPMDREDIQQCVVNVNIYVQNLVIDNGDTVDKSLPDTERLEYLTKLFNQALGGGEEVWPEDADWTFKIQQDHTIEDSNNQHYQNFRIVFKSAFL